MFIFKTLCIKWKLLWAFVDGANTTRSLERNLLQSFKNVCFAMKCNLPPRLARVWKSKIKVYPFWKHYQLLFSAATLFFLMKNTYEKYIIVSKAISKKRPNGLTYLSYLEEKKMPNLGFHLCGHFVQILWQESLKRSGLCSSWKRRQRIGKI